MDAVNRARPAVNVAALVGHTTLRNNQMDRLDRAATSDEIDAMRAELREALDTRRARAELAGSQYASAFSAPTEEVMALAEPLAEAGGLYATHMRTEFAGILDAMDEAFSIGRHARVPVADFAPQVRGPRELGTQRRGARSARAGGATQPVGCDCYPYNRQLVDARPEAGDRRRSRSRSPGPSRIPRWRAS